MQRGTAAGTAATGLALLAAAPTPATAVATLATAASTADPFAPLLSLIALVAWGLLIWLIAVALAASATRLPGRRGRTAGYVARRIAPAGVRRFVEAALGLTVAAAALGASPAWAGTHAPPAPPAASTSALDWPAPPRPTAAPSLDWNPAPTAAPTTRARASAPVVVEPGDSLWAVAAEHLPAGATNAQIAQAWPTWWSANRAAVGPDPDLIHPGLSLTPPAQH